ncbi:MAG TPA: two-component regulator propeller domain-containing protein [Marinilabiliaceae bacterium]|nr:two-component regulator propeller domain-containing protein [Marinilabiliaceae bacterium]
MIRYFFIFLLLFLPFNLLDGFSQTANSPLEQLTISNGLSNNIVNAVFQDSKGFMWVGTEDGLNRYDGYNFEVFRFQHDEINCIGGNRVTAINEDHIGNIWIGLRDRGIGFYNLKTGRFTNFQYEQDDANSIPVASVHKIHITSSEEVWIVTDLYLSRFNSDNNSFVNYTIPFSRTTGSAQGSFVEENDSTFLIGTNEGLKRFHVSQESFTDVKIIFENKESSALNVFSIIRVGGDSFLLGTNKGLIKWHSNGEFILLDNIEMPKNSYSQLLFATNRENTKWIASDNIIYLYDIDSGFLQRINELDDGFVITSLLQDSSGILWIGTKFNGLFKQPSQKQKFYFYNGKDLNDKEVSGFNVQSIFVENDSIVWMGTRNNGFAVFNYQTREKVFSGPKNKKWKEGKTIYSIYQTEDGEVWMGTNTGLFVLDRTNNQLEPFHGSWSEEMKQRFSNTVVTAFIKDSSNCLWVGTRSGLYRIDRNDIQPFYKNDENHELNSDYIHTLRFDSEGTLLIGTASGVCYYDSETSLIRKIKHADDLFSLKNQVITMTNDRENVLWLGTNLGLLKMVRTHGDSALISLVPGLDYEMITSVLIDKSNRTWVSSSKAVSMLMADGGIRRFEAYDGLPDQMFNPGSTALSPSGDVFFGSVSGLSWSQPDSIQYNSHLPPIVVVSAKLCHKGECSDLGSGLIESLEMKYRSGIMLQVSLAALDYNQPSRNFFQIYLEGYDETWRPPSSSNTYSFANLSPGKYILKVRASNNDFVWNDRVLEVPINIRSPLWLSKFAYLFYAFIFVVTVQLFVNYRVRHYRRANRILTEKNNDKMKLEEQQVILTKIHRNITDSINYALRIQTAMMPSLEAMRGLFSKIFVYFRPKDLVSGDFYWMHRRNHNTFVAVADSTGHGVPGAFMSIIGINLLKSAIVAAGETSPDRILDVISRELELTLHNDPTSFSSNVEAIRDALDISLCVINTKKKELHFAGAIHDLYLVRGNEIQVFKGDRSVIGRMENGDFPKFTSHSIHLEKDDMVYLFTDGYADQFGGPNSKKFMYRRFRHLLLNLHHLDLDAQKEIIHAKFEEWRGSEEQVDDILVLGFKPLS